MTPVVYGACRGSELEFQLAQAIQELERRQVHDELELQLSMSSNIPIGFVLTEKGRAATKR